MAELDDVIEHHLARQQPCRPGSPAHQRFRLTNDGQLVQRLLGPDFLDHADYAVGDDEQAEQRVDHRTRQQHDRQQHAPKMALIRVKTLARTMSAMLRAARWGTALLLPSATRCATSASLRPETVIA
jgi:hypothetical protein